MVGPVFIKGDPYPAWKAGGDREAPGRWSSAIVSETRALSPVCAPCKLDVEFILNKEKFTDDVPYGTDLDNLLELVFDALGKTVFAAAKRTDSVVVEVHASKRWAREHEPAGAKLQITPRPWP